MLFVQNKDLELGMDPAITENHIQPRTRHGSAYIERFVCSNQKAPGEHKPGSDHIENDAMATRRGAIRRHTHMFTTDVRNDYFSFIRSCRDRSLHKRFLLARSSFSLSSSCFLATPFLAWGTAAERRGNVASSACNMSPASLCNRLI